MTSNRKFYSKSDSLWQRWNNHIFSVFLNTDIDEDEADVTSLGRLFDIIAPAAGKARPPTGAAVVARIASSARCELLTQMSNVYLLSLPAKRDANLVYRLRSTMKYPTVRVRTNLFKNSFIPYSLSNIQRHLQT